MTTKSVAEVNVTELYYTHARIRPVFSGCGRRLEDTLQQIYSGAISLDSIPRLTVTSNECPRTGKTHMFCMNNRRLWVMKELHSRGYFSNGKGKDKPIKVRVKEAQGKETGRFTTEKCSLHARLMLEKEKGKNPGGEGDGEGNEDDDQGEADSEDDNEDGSPAAGGAFSSSDAGVGEITRGLAAASVFTKSRAVVTAAAAAAAEDEAAARLAALQQHFLAKEQEAVAKAAEEAAESAAVEFAVSQGLDRDAFLTTYRRIAEAKRTKVALDALESSAMDEAGDGGEATGADSDSDDSDGDPEPHKCEVCCKAFKEEKQLAQHLNSKPHKQALKDAKSSAKKKGGR